MTQPQNHKTELIPKTKPKDATGLKLCSTSQNISALIGIPGNLTVLGFMVSQEFHETN